MNLTSDTVGLSMPIDSNFYLPAEKIRGKLCDINTVERYTENYERYVRGRTGNNIISYHVRAKLQHYEKQLCKKRK